MKLEWSDLRFRALKGIELSFLWVPVFLLVYINQNQYLNKNLYLPVARTAGYSDVEDMQIVDYLHFFQSSIIEFVYIIPLITILLSIVYYARPTRYIVLASAIIFLIVNFVNLLSVANVGNLLSLNLLYSTAEWGLDNPAMISGYLSVGALMKFALLLSMILTMYYLLVRNKGFLYKLFRYSAFLYFILSVIIGAGVLVFNQTARVSGLVSGEYFTITQFNGLIEKEEILTQIEDLPDEQQKLSELFREKTHSQISATDISYVGGEAGKNVLFFILETAPNEAILDRSDSGMFENLNFLKNNAFYSENHYSTYPYTSDALFSIFASLYPDKIRRRIATGDYQLNELGVLNALKNNNYFTNIYGHKEFEAESDHSLFEKLGATQQYFSYDDENIEELLAGDNDLLKVPAFNHLADMEKEYLQYIYEQDVAAMEKMLVDIREYAGNNQKFASVFLPQFGHAPWADMSSEGDVFDDGAALFDIQDKWLGYILDSLRELEILDDTIIIITGDHGLRTKTEFPDLTSSFMNKVSFNVPLIIYAPDTLSQTSEISSLTSHIDIGPTILSLLGIKWNELCMLGSPIWDQNLANRMIYFNGKSYYGNTGYFHDNEFVSYNSIQKRFFKNGEMVFAQENNVTENLELLKYNIEYQQAFQKQLMQLIEKGEFCNGVVQ